MEIKLLYYTPQYPKLVETVMRICYQSYDKETESSHNSVRSIMSKGHLSIASVGNLVFEVDGIYDNGDYEWLLEDLILMKEDNDFVKFSIPYREENESKSLKISMNILSFLEILKARNKKTYYNDTFEKMLELTNEIDELKWFYDKSVKLPDSINPYSAKGFPQLYKPIVLDEDYTKLKALGLNNYELGIHSTITMNFVTDRSASLQLWRHWSGGCELSQRYVLAENEKYRELIVDDKNIEKLMDKTGKDEFTVKNDIESLNKWLISINDVTSETYDKIYNYCVDLGMTKGRAKEFARSILPNAIHTQCIQSRPYKNWLHLFELRDSTHAQREVQEDVIHMKRVLKELKIPTEKY